MFFGYEFESTCGDNINIYIYRMQLLIFFSFNIKYFFNFNILSIFKSYYIMLYHI